MGSTMIGWKKKIVRILESFMFFFSGLHHHIARQLKATVSYQDENAISKRQIKKETRLAQCQPASLGRNDVSRL